MYEVLENAKSLLSDITRQPIWDALKKEQGFFEDPPTGDGYLFKIVVADKLWVEFLSDPADSKTYLGFWYEGRKTNAVRETLEEALDNVLSEDYFNSFKGWDGDGRGITREFAPECLQKPIPEIEEYFLEQCKKLEKVARILSL